ncbi:MAG: LysR family transcriptional regulator [Rhizobiaceae bacterium]
MNINQLKALQLVVKTGSVSETARAMNLSQPAISKMIRTLEGELGRAAAQPCQGKGRTEGRAEHASSDRGAHRTGDLGSRIDHQGIAGRQHRFPSD